MKRIAVFADSQYYGGAEGCALTLLRHLDRSRFAPMLIHHGGEGVAPLREGARDAGVPELVVPPMPDGARGARHCAAFARVLRQERVDVLHVQLRWPLVAKYALAAGVFARLPAVVATAHCVDPDVVMSAPTALQQYMLSRRVSRYIAVSQYAADKLARQLPWPKDRIVVIHNGIDEPSRRAADPALRAELSGPQKLPVAFTASNLYAIKGLDVLVEAAALAPAIRFAVAGEGPEHDALARRIAELGIESRVALLGWRSDVGELLASSDALVLPSRGEALPTAAIEALAYGKPVVATRVGGVPEVVADGETGVLVPSEDAPALARELSALLGDAERRERMSVAARAAFLERFSVDRMVGAIESLYDEVLAGRPGRGAGRTP